jgi:membrane protein implicated in regulation of membrane protease activity
MDQVVVAAVITTVAILAIAASYRVLRRRAPEPDAYDASGRRVVPVGATGTVRTALAPTGVVYAAGEEWTARATDRATLAPGLDIRVVGQDGLTLIVEPVSRDTRTEA